MPKYQRNLPRPGQAALGNPPVGPIGGMMPPQPGIPPQQQGMRPPMPPHGNHKFPSFLFLKRFVKLPMLAGRGEAFHKMHFPLFFKKIIKNYSLHLNCSVYRSVWCSSPGHARISSWRNASIWSGTSDGAPVPEWTPPPSDGNETARNVARWPLLMLLLTL